MSAETGLFWFLAFTAGLGAISVVLTQNVVRMAFWLIVSLGSVAGLFFLLHADFVGATQLLVYVGGTVVLLIFGVMLTASGPFNQLKMSPGSLILVSGVAVIVLFIVTQSVTSVNWDRSALRLVLIEAEQMGVLKSEIEDEETLELLAAAYKEYRVGDTDLFEYKPEESLSADDDAKLKAALEANGLDFSPKTDTGGTIRPIGFALLGSRPDRDLAPEGLQKISSGYYVPRPESRGSEKADDESVAVSTGYLLPFEIASVHLLVVLIGAAYLARAKRRVDSAV